MILMGTACFTKKKNVRNVSVAVQQERFQKPGMINSNVIFMAKNCRTI